MSSLALLWVELIRADFATSHWVAVGVVENSKLTNKLILFEATEAQLNLDVVAVWNKFAGESNECNSEVSRTHGHLLSIFSHPDSLVSLMYFDAFQVAADGNMTPKSALFSEHTPPEYTATPHE